MSINFVNRFPGRAHDARVWQLSDLSAKLPDLCQPVGNVPVEDSYHILGDSAYPLSNYLLTPYRVVREPNRAAKAKYNQHFCSKRSRVETSFGLLGLRFPKLLKLKCKSDESRIYTVVFCCVAHNWCIMEDDDDKGGFEEVEAFDDGDIGIPADAYLGRNIASGTGNFKRDYIAAQILHLP